MTGSNVLRNHMLASVCIPLLLIAVSLSFYRFIIARDYDVAYEADCDPTMESCFVGCEDDACDSVYYYMQVERQAADLYAACGPDITDCAEALECLPTDRHCMITYCDPSVIGSDETCAAIGTEGTQNEEEQDEEVIQEAS